LLPSRDTLVTYPDGALVATSRALHVAPVGDGRVAILTERTSFHPVDAAWPDQPADAGFLRAGDESLVIRDAVVAATDGASLHLGADIPVRKGTEGWSFLVAHLVDEGAAIAEGDEVVIEADAALNRALADRWSKAARADALGSPDFDGMAIASSRIVANGSVDRYRLNKSLRRAGFDTASLPVDLDGLRQVVADQLQQWLALGAVVRVEHEGDELTERRTWVCELPDGTARIPCGGTHLDSLAALSAVEPTLTIADDAGTPVLEMTTQVRLRH
jgi:alanyl-tRNA synthetase